MQPGEEVMQTWLEISRFEALEVWALAEDRSKTPRSL